MTDQLDDAGLARTGRRLEASAPAGAGRVRGALAEECTIRAAYPADQPRLKDLAVLDAARLVCGPHLIAEVQDEPRARRVDADGPPDDRPRSAWSRAGRTWRRGGSHAFTSSGR